MGIDEYGNSSEKENTEKLVSNKNRNIHFASKNSQNKEQKSQGQVIHNFVEKIGQVRTCIGRNIINYRRKRNARQRLLNSFTQEDSRCMI